MTTHRKRIVAAVRDILPDGTTLTVERGGKHCRLVITQGTHTVRLPVASTPTDNNAARSAVRQAKRLFDEAGVLRPPSR